MKASKKSYVLNNRYNRGAKKKKNIYIYIYILKCIQEGEGKGKTEAINLTRGVFGK